MILMLFFVLLCSLNLDSSINHEQIPSLIKRKKKRKKKEKKKII